MASAAERMRSMRARRRTVGLRKIRLVVPDARSAEVSRRITKQVASLDPADEEEAMRWIEAVSEFDEPAPPQDETRRRRDRLHPWR